MEDIADADYMHAKRGTCHTIHWYAKAYNKYMKDYMIKIKSHHFLNIGMQIIFMVGQCRRSLQSIILNGSKILLRLMKVSCSFFVIFCSLLVIFCWLLVTFCLLVVTFCSLLVTRLALCLLFFVPCSLLSTRCSLFFRL